MDVVLLTVIEVLVVMSLVENVAEPSANVVVEMPVCAVVLSDAIVGGEDGVGSTGVGGTGGNAEHVARRVQVHRCGLVEQSCNLPSA